MGGDGDKGSLGSASKAAGSGFADAPVGSAVAPCPEAEIPSKCRYLLPDNANATVSPSAYDRLRKKSKPAKLGPETQTTYVWRKGEPPSPAIERDVDVDGQKIKLIYPPDPERQNQHLPSPEQVAESLRAVPADQRQQTQQVVLSPAPSANDPKAAGEGGSGEIDIYPAKRDLYQHDVDYRIMHEEGHNYQGKYWQPNPDEVRAWQKAAADDGKKPSTYGDGIAGEDFCEFLVLYNAAKGTDCEATAKKLYPNRWKKMDEYASKK